MLGANPDAEHSRRIHLLGDDRVFRVDSKTPGDIVARRTSDGTRVYLAAAYEPCFPPERFGTYDCFTTLEGEVLKDEARTRIVRFADAGPGGRREFALKYYSYSTASQCRTWYRQSVAHAEFSALCYLQNLGVPCVAPVACGLKRSPVGSVASCFLVTEFAEGFVGLREWLRAHPMPTPAETAALHELARELGAAVRTMHLRRLFVSRLSAKNLLIRFEKGGTITWRMIDHPFADYYPRDFQARFMQSYDLGRLKNSLLGYGQEAFFEEFLTTYEPDPLGRGGVALLESIAYGVDIRRNRTPLLRAAQAVKGAFARTEKR